MTVVIVTIAACKVLRKNLCVAIADKPHLTFVPYLNADKSGARKVIHPNLGNALGKDAASQSYSLQHQVGSPT